MLVLPDKRSLTMIKTNKIYANKEDSFVSFLNISPCMIYDRDTCSYIQRLKLTVFAMINKTIQNQGNQVSQNIYRKYKRYQKYRTVNSYQYSNIVITQQQRPFNGL